MRSKQAIDNAKWIIGCKIIQSVLQLIIGMISARYLGPSNYGLISYASSIVAFALPIMKLGLDSVLIHELIEAPDREGEIMGTSLFLNLISGTVCMGGTFILSWLINLGDIETVIVCLLYGTSIVFAALEMIIYWFQYKLLAKYSSIVTLIAYLFVSIYKIFLLATSKSVYWFALSHSIEYGIVGVLLLLLYKAHRGDTLSFSWSRAQKLLSHSKHYILAAIMIVIIQNTDRIMLTAMVGKAENGYYTAAITSVGITQFVFVAIIDSFRPLILSSKKSNNDEYEHNISRLYGAIIYLSIAQSLAFTLLAPLIIALLYGKEYASAAQVLQILTWYCPFSFMGIIRNIWLLAEKKQKYLPLINFIGVLLNILLNAIAIPIWGACGAAVASLMTQAVMNFVLGFVLKPVRHNNVLMMRGLSIKYLLRFPK